MSDDIAIRVENLSKQYPIFDKPRDRLKQMLLPSLARVVGLESHKYFKEFWALKDISFEVRKGEAVGILGRNGAGKSTLLQIICGTLAASSGSVVVNGRVAALLELGSGFNPEFTGRENASLGTALQGLSREEREAVMPGIEEFAEIGRFIDQPVKTYSSGMLMRLAFAVNTCVVPEIMIVDEALSVGDAVFQAKCFRRLREIQQAGCSILFVSHDAGVVINFCQKAMWLADGELKRFGEAKAVCRAYEVDCLRKGGMKIEDADETGDQALDGRRGQAADSRMSTAELSPEVAKWSQADRKRFEECRGGCRSGAGALEIVNFLIVDETDAPVETVKWDENYRAVFVVRSKCRFEGLYQVGLRVSSLEGVHLFHCADLMHSTRVDLAAGQAFTAILPIGFPLTSGSYAILAAIFTFPLDGLTPLGTCDYTRSTLSHDPGTCAYIRVAPQSYLGIAGPVQFTSHIKTIV